MLASSDRILSPHNSPPSTMSPNLDHRLQMPPQRENRDSHLLLEVIKGSRISSSQTHGTPGKEAATEFAYMHSCRL